MLPTNRFPLGDLRALLQLAGQGTQALTDVVEGVHASVWRTLGVRGPAPGRTGGLTGLVYRGVRGASHATATVLDGLLARVEPPASAQAPASRRRQALQAALNGVMGDHLAANHNPLALPMRLYHRGEPLDPARPGTLPRGRRLLVLVHGLCMSELDWQGRHDDAPVDHGQALAAAHGYIPLYLRYNSGLHIADNGQMLSVLLEALLGAWPEPIERLALLGHSMGGLVARSAVHQAERDGRDWPRHLRHLACLGTPHHGAPLERAGNGLELLLSSTPYSAPLARLGQLRSAGITDLRYGHLLHEDAAGRGRFERGADTRRPVPLPDGVACYTLAAALAGRRSAVVDRLTGDGLVPLRSALGEHDDPHRALAFGRRHRHVLHGVGHLGLLREPAVSRQLVDWLAPRRRRP